MMDEVRARGLDAVMLEAVKIASAHTAGFGLSIDIDAFDPKIAPGTGTIEEGGLLKDEFIKAAQNTLAGYKEKLLALEIAEYNPHKDKKYITAKLIGDIVGAVLG
jgi:arginase